MSRIVLVRHGETVWHEENRYAGQSDIALTPQGVAQAEALAHWAAAAKLNAIWSSPLSRARLTAMAAAQAANLPLQIDDRLTELSFGIGEGLTRAEMQERLPRERAAFEVDPAANFLHEGEDPLLAARRGVTAFHELDEAYGPTARILVVGHSTLFRLVLCDLLGIQLSRYRTVFPIIANASWTEIKLTPMSAALLFFNVPISPINRGTGA